MDKEQSLFSGKVGQLFSKYKKELEKIYFAAPERKKLPAIEAEGSLVDFLELLVNSSLELNHIFEQCPDSIYVTDGQGITQRVNKAFESTTHIDRHLVMGKDVAQLEKQGMFKPSVCNLVIKEGRKISVLQTGKGTTAVVTGVPLLNEAGGIDQIITNARALNEINEITFYIESEAHKNKGGGAGTIIAESQSMKDILELAQQIASVDSTVMITGESGVGKGVLAQYIHDHSLRSSQKLIHINCGAIPEALLESELFGYESGAFTGADKRGKKGLIELADGGTLFLDEIGELPMMLQVKLLNFLQNKTILRVGGTREILVDVRIIAATNRNLMELVENGEFREDLFYRIHVVPIQLPPLRERQEDILPAAEYFCKVFCQKYQKQFVLDPEIKEDLLQHQWPGNMRELENYIERKTVIGGNSKSGQLFDPGLQQPTKDPELNRKTLKQRIEDLESQLVKEAYDQYHNTYKVAQVLGISQPSASRKINKYVEMKAK